MPPANITPHGSTYRGSTWRGSSRRALTLIQRHILLALSLSLSLLIGCPPDMGPPDGTNGDGTGTISVELVADGLTAPVALVPAPDDTGRLFVVDQVGQVRIITAQGQLEDTPFLDLSDAIVELMPDFDERGLLGLAFHPDYTDNGRFFIFYTAPKGPDVPDDFNSETRIAEFTVSTDDADVADPQSERVLLTIAKPQFNHNGGTLAFGPDGFLYTSHGDGGAANDTGLGHTDDIGNGQDLTKLLGTILRIDVDSGDPYGIPADNPFVGDEDARDEIWAYGLRNPYRMSFDAGGSRRLFVGDAGQNLFEEVDIIERGANYGWNIKEGAHCFDPQNPDMPPATCPDVGPNGRSLVDPIIEYPHVDDQGNLIGIAVVGGFVYRGTDLPDFQGDYIFGDYSLSFTEPDGAIFIGEEQDDGTWSMREPGIANREGGRMNRFILGFGQDRDGEVYVLTSQNTGPTGTTGEVYRIAPPQ
jgi:glucose/arabinose dehydrogenase